LVADKKMDKNNNIELRSEEVQEIMGEIPTWIIRWGITLLCCIVVCVLIGSYFFKYPVVAKTIMTLTNTIPVSEIYSCSTGRITDIYVKNNDRVKKGTLLAVKENTAKSRDVFLLKEALIVNNENPQYLTNNFSDRILRLGSIQSAYSVFLSKTPADHNYITAWNELLNELRQWEMNYCFFASSSGIIELRQSNMKNYKIESNELFARIIPENIGDWVGKAKLPITDAGNVSKGKKVIVRFFKYPYHEYGMVEGVISTMSKLPFEEYYELEIAFPFGFVTNFGKLISPSFGMKADVEIIKEDVRLLEYFFQPLRNN